MPWARPGPGRPARGLAGLHPTPGQGLTVNRGKMSPHGSWELVMATLLASWSMAGRAAACGNVDGVVWAEWLRLCCVFPPGGLVVGLGPDGPFCYAGALQEELCELD